jgi:tRNA pseudouridine65 synthase
MEVVFEDDFFIAINKPTGVFVHKTNLDPSAKIFALQYVRNLIGQHVYSVHRLDRKTSGLLLFAKDRECQVLTNHLFATQKITKKYIAIVRGYVNDYGVINYDILLDNGKKVNAITHYRCLQKVELPIKTYQKFETSRYSLLSLSPFTGRQHQLRRHLAHIFHPIIGDRPHGCNKQNRAFLQFFNMSEMLLHNRFMSFLHPITGESIEMKAPIFGTFSRMIQEMGFDPTNIDD